MKKRTKVLVVGAGSIGQKEIKELQSHPLIKLVGVVEKSRTRRDAITSRKYPTFTNLKTALNKTKPDLVRIATPPHTHMELACMALKAGCDVYLEKIMTIRSADSRKILRTAKKHKKKVYVRRNAIYTAVYQDAWDRLAEIGEIRHIHWIEPREEYSYWNHYKQKWLKNLPGGIISEHLPHALYTVRWFLGGEPDVKDVYFNGDELQVNMKYKNITAHISYIRQSDVPMLLQIVGSHGTLYINHSTYRVYNPPGYEHEKSPEIRTLKANLHDLFGSMRNLTRLVGHFLLRELKLQPTSIYAKSDNYRQFTDIVRGKVFGDFDISGEEGLRNVILFEKIWKKAGELE